ncbi:2,3-diaminopropionate biosynthesis protein SbnA [Arthrobacter mangrovi]|uniref:2,3-diaminopropionate biosynthesis protein SbnA n=1 Tax=Arthrobacter mangrovi TaxID=2966350 RepID=A0ABQ5MPY1_9MICC|nr:2,3-diaminopropionate biosynthesis protein SbnA [Arthrobacter mangrovi]GLB66033.1 2,3-diaminopropionate biosynthesis protein SbnA [Arthrobacter mangrovi]
MPIITDPHLFNEQSLFVDLEGVLGRRLYLKIEGFNFAGSVKLKPAREMVEQAERAGLIGPGSVLIESSSGNLGVALSMIAASKGYHFVCVVDPRCNPATAQLMEALGAQVDLVTEPDPVDGFLGARLNHVRELCANDDRYVWLNQYSNPGNWGAHYRWTAPEIADEFPDLDVLFVGAGTTGTLMGCARYFREHRPDVRIVAVDAVGSVSFGQPPATRLIPGLGMSVRPPQLDESLIDDVVFVEEVDTVRACHRLAAAGYLLGGSTGTVVHGAMTWLEAHRARNVTAVTISPDMGRPYLDTIYQPDWVLDHFGADAAASAAVPGLQSEPVPAPQLPAAAPMTESDALRSISQ